MAIGGEDERQNDIPPVAPPDLRLRGEWPPVTRLSRKMLIGLGAVSALANRGCTRLRAPDPQQAASRPGVAQHPEPSIT
ncbi:hypothetical protein ACVWZK_009457 [Bradyrhizobium sp. GM0.4]